MSAVNDQIALLIAEHVKEALDEQAQAHASRVAYLGERLGEVSRARWSAHYVALFLGLALVISIVVNVVAYVESLP